LEFGGVYGLDEVAIDTRLLAALHVRLLTIARDSYQKALLHARQASELTGQLIAIHPAWQAYIQNDHVKWMSQGQVEGLPDVKTSRMHPSLAGSSLPASQDQWHADCLSNYEAEPDEATMARDAVKESRMSYRIGFRPGKSLRWFDSVASSVFIALVAACVLPLSAAAALLGKVVLLLSAGNASSVKKASASQVNGAGEDFDAELRQLAQLWKSGVLTDREYERKRVEVMWPKW
jgi:hypothetical protein